jgi:hypothetical protein
VKKWTVVGYYPDTDQVSVEVVSAEYPAREAKAFFAKMDEGCGICAIIPGSHKDVSPARSPHPMGTGGLLYPVDVSKAP